MSTSHVDNLTLGRGEAWFVPFLAGTTTPDPGGYRFLGNIPQFNVSVTTEEMKHKRSTRGVSETDRTIVLNTERSASLTIEDIVMDNLAFFLLGDAEVVAQSSGSSLTEDFDDVKLGRRYYVGVTAANPVGYHSLTTPVLKKGVTTLVENTDYTIDAERGFFELLSTSATVADGDDLTLEFGRAAKSRDQVVSGSAAANGALRFTAYPGEGDPIDFFMPNVEFSPNGDFSLVTDSQLQTLPIKASINTLGSLEAIYANGLPYAVS